MNTADHDRTRSLLKLLRAPTSVLDRVSEECRLHPGEMEREVLLRFKRKSLPTKEGFVYVDILHPRRGELIDISVDEQNGVTRAAHDEHVEVGSAVIAHRLTTVVNSMGIPHASFSVFVKFIGEAFARLPELPGKSVTEGEGELDYFFDRNTQSLKALPLMPGATVDAEKMRLLFRLCERLVKRYFALVKVPVRDGVVADVRFAYKQRVADDDPEHRSGWARVLSSRRAVYSGSVPPNFRVHLPWAKRCDHYTLQMDADDGSFIARQGLVSRAADGELKKLPENTPTRWAMNYGQARHALVFINGGRGVNSQIYLGLQNLELPGGSISRVSSLAGLVVLGLIGFLVFVALGGRAVEVGSLVLALAAIGAFAATPSSPGEGVIGVPVISRRAPLWLATMIVFFIFWFSQLGLVLPTWPGELLGPLRPAAVALRDVIDMVAGPAIVVAAAFLYAVLIRRRRRIRRAYAIAFAALPASSVSMN